MEADMDQVLLRSARQGLLMGQLLTVALCTTVNYATAQVAREGPSSPIDTVLDVRGYRLHFLITPGSSPTIVLETGGGGDVSQWSAVQPELARLIGSAVVSYDRAGFGESELPVHPYSALEEVAVLRACLEQLGLAESVILVGQSYGGLLNLLYAHEYPESVKGIVLIDPNTVAFIDAVGGVDQLDTLEQQQPSWTPYVQHAPEYTKAYKAGIRQGRALPVTVEMVRGATIPRKLPMIVVTAGKSWWSKAETNVAWRAAHESLVADAPNWKLLVAEETGHNIPRERPDIVIAAIQELIRAIGATQ